MLGVSSHAMKGKKESKKSKKDIIKVTYISSPVKVKTSASNFRALVQELTGQDSNVAEMSVEANNNNYNGADNTFHNKGPTQQWISEACFPHATDWLKPDCSYMDSRSSMEQLNWHLQYDLLDFDIL